MSNYNKLYQYLRPIIFYIYNFRCYACDVESSVLQIHHSDLKVKNNDPLNLFPLCGECHKSVHSGVLSFKFEVPTAFLDSLLAVRAFVRRSNL